MYFVCLGMVANASTIRRVRSSIPPHTHKVFVPFRFEMKGGITLLDFRDRAGKFVDFESFPALYKPHTGNNKMFAYLRRFPPL